MNNINNKLISQNDLETFINSYTCIYDPNIKVKINNLSLLHRTLVHKSFNNISGCVDDVDNYCNINFSRKLTGNNERLEFLGDRVLDLVVAEYLFDLFPLEQEGFLSDTKIKLVKKETLNYLACSINLPDFMLINNMMERSGERSQNISLPENIFESFIGGLFKDQNSNFYICKAFILGVFKLHINLQEVINTDTNFKTSVNKEFHKNCWNSNPQYRLIKNTGDITGRQFNSVLCVYKKDLSSASLKIVQKLKDLDIKNREKIKKYQGDCVDEALFVLTFNEDPQSTKKKAEQRCSEIFMKDLSQEIANLKI